MNFLTHHSGRHRLGQWGISAIIFAAILFAIWNLSGGSSRSTITLKDGSKLHMHLLGPAVLHRNPFASLKQKAGIWLPRDLRVKMKLPLPRTLQAPDGQEAISVWIRLDSPNEKEFGRLFPLRLRILDDSGSAVSVPIQEGSNTRARGMTATNQCYQGAILTVWPRDSKMLRVQVYSAHQVSLGEFDLPNPGRSIARSKTSQVPWPISIHQEDLEFRLLTFHTHVDFDPTGPSWRPATEVFNSGTVLQFDVLHHGQRQHDWQFRMDQPILDTTGNVWKGYRPRIHVKEGVITCFLQSTRLPTHVPWHIPVTFIPPKEIGAMEHTVNFFANPLPMEPILD